MNMGPNTMNIAEEKFASIAPRAPRGDRSLGAILMDVGRLKPEDAERILIEQKRNGVLFGEAAISLGLITQADIEMALSRQFDYPYLRPGDESVSRELIAAFNPFSPIVEQMRALRSQLMLRWFTGEAGQNAVAIVSAERTEGRSFIAANLAVVLSQLGEKTLLIDANLRHPRQHELFRLENRLGLSAVLSDRADLECAISIPTLLSLSVLPAGATPPNPQELLGRPRFTKLLAQAADSFDVVVIDTPAASEGADVELTAVRAGAAVIVARNNHTNLAAAKSLSDRLTQSRSVVLGAVLCEH